MKIIKILVFWILARFFALEKSKQWIIIFSRQGHKWTLSSLWQHFAEQGIDNKPVLESIKDLVIKTIISAENSMHNVYRQNMASHYCGYELFGFDVLLDAKLKPWLIEVNISPSLHSASPLDLDVKSPMATEVFNLVNIWIFARFFVLHNSKQWKYRNVMSDFNFRALFCPAK